MDWAEEFHLVALGRPGEGVIEVVPGRARARRGRRLVARIAELEPDPAEVRVVLETRHGMLVEALLDAGFTVLPVNPDLVARRRGPARKKDDAEDARIACRWRWTDTELRPLIPHGELAGELRAIARDDERAGRDERRLLNRLRADLLATFPAALTIAGDDLGAPTMLRLLQRWPTAAELAAASQRDSSPSPAPPARLAATGSPTASPPRWRTPQFPARDRAGPGQADTHPAGRRPAAAARRATPRLGAADGRTAARRRRRGRDRQPTDPDQRGPAVPGGEIYLSFPGLGDRLAARVAGEIGDAIGQFDTPNALQCYAGKRPGHPPLRQERARRRRRLACNRYLADAVQQWAFTSLRQLRLGPRVLRRPTIAAARATTPPCAPWATAGWKSSGLIGEARRGSPGRPAVRRGLVGLWRPLGSR